MSDPLRPASIALKPVSMPGGELLPPGWFALHPDQFDGEDAQARAHGRWFRIATGHGAVYRALQLTPGLPREGVALDWPARHALEGGHAGAGLESAPRRFDIRSARLVEYPRCLLAHPSPAARLGGQAALAAFVLCLAALLATLVVGLGLRLPGPAEPGATAAGSGTAQPSAPAIADASSFIAALTGNWQGAGERLLIKQDKGVVEILRETRVDDGQLRLDQYAVAPVRYDAGQRQLLLETPDGQWRLTWLPGTPRAKLSVSYPDQRNVLYE